MRPINTLNSYFILFTCILLGVGCKNKEDKPEDVLSEKIITELTSLPEEINESSGLLNLDGEIWTINDSGDANNLYLVSKEADELRHTIHLDNAENIDWEDLAINEDFIYVGDFGNNNGNRENLGIYKLNKIDLTQSITNSNPIEFIQFIFEDQKEFEDPSNDHNFDCEAMISFNNEIYLFSKNRGDKFTKQYKLDQQQAAPVAKLVSIFDVNGLITAADMNKDTNKLALLGYNFLPDNEFEVFVWIFTDFPDDRFFEGTATQYQIDITTQAEGIAWKSNNELYISCEAENGGSGKLYLWEM